MKEIKSIDLNKLEQQLDEALAKETPESLNKWLDEENMEERKYADLRLDVDQDDKLATEATIDGDKIIPPKNYLIGKITKVDNGMLVEFVKKQPQYPKTYEECCQHLGCDDKLNVGELIPFQQLVNARNAYWKIAGEQIGLGEPWEPDWCSELDLNYTIIYNGMYINKIDGTGRYALLAFPTKEMRDAFYENFKELIEQCKELL